MGFKVDKKFPLLVRPCVPGLQMLTLARSLQDPLALKHRIAQAPRHPKESRVYRVYRVYGVYRV